MNTVRSHARTMMQQIKQFARSIKHKASSKLSKNYGSRSVSNGMKMKKLLLATFVSLILFTAPVLAAHYWKVDISTPKPLINLKTFNVEYVSSTTDTDDVITVELFENEVSKGIQTTSGTQYGDSGAFSVTVPSDGTYQYFMKTSSSVDGAGSNTATKTVVVDTTAPSGPIYISKARDGNTYTLTFTVPSDGDAAEIRIYSSPNTTFTADSSTQVGLVTVAPGETKTFTYTAPTSSERFFALQTFDQAGNFSPLVADQNVVVAQGTPAATGVTANTTGEVGGEGAATAAATNDANGDGIADEGQVLGEQTDEGGSNWIWVAAVVALAIATYYLTILRPRRTPGKK